MGGSSGSRLHSGGIAHRATPARLMVAPDLLWHCVRDKSSFIRKRKNCPVFNAEPGNLPSLNRFAYSGLASKRVINLYPKKVGKKESIVMITKSQKVGKLSKPSKFLTTSGVEKCPKKGIKQIEKVTQAVAYRPDLEKLAKIKYQKICQSFKKPPMLKKAKTSDK